MVPNFEFFGQIFFDSCPFFVRPSPFPCHNGTTVVRDVTDSYDDKVVHLYQKMM